MRSLVSAIVAVGALLASAPALAQAYDPNYPVCLHVYGGGMGGGNWIDCSYVSMAQCAASASGRSAMCEVNPFYGYARRPMPIPPPHSRRAW